MNFYSSIRRVSLMTIIVWLASACFGQIPVEEATRLAQSGRWSEAHDLLQPAVQQNRDLVNGHDWYVLGFIQKELHKNAGESGVDAYYRAQSVESFQLALAHQSLAQTERENSMEALDFLSRSYFREAIEMVEGFTYGAEKTIFDLMFRYEDIQRYLNPEFDKTEQRSDLHRYLAQAYSNLLETERFAETETEDEILDKAILHFESSLTMDADNYATRYNYAITLYNHGVRQLKRINHNTSMFQLMEIQDACVALFERSLPPMEQAHAQRPDRLETLKGLMTIHYALSQKDESDAYRRQMEQLLQKR